MIYTVTFNPALDYVVKVEHFALGSVNRTIRENIFYGGKGINVSALLANLGYRSTALGFIAGFTGREIERGVRSLGFDSDFIQVEKGMSRINVKLKSDQESEINGMGPEITAGDVDQLFEKLSYLKKEDVLVLSGSIPAAIDSDIYQRIMERLDGRGIRMVVDAEKDLLLKVLKYRPFLIKPNNHELGSMAGNGAILVAEDGSVHRRQAARGTVKNSVGAGDSMVAGFIAGYLEKGDYAYALKLGTACGGATAFSDGIGTKDEIMRLLNTL